MPSSERGDVEEGGVGRIGNECVVSHTLFECEGNATRGRTSEGDFG